MITKFRLYENTNINLRNYSGYFIRIKENGLTNLHFLEDIDRDENGYKLKGTIYTLFDNMVNNHWFNGIYYNNYLNVEHEFLSAEDLINKFPEEALILYKFINKEIEDQWKNNVWLDKLELVKYQFNDTDIDQIAETEKYNL